MMSEEASRAAPASERAVMGDVLLKTVSGVRGLMSCAETVNGKSSLLPLRGVARQGNG
jgi:hypothetical protein